MARADDPALTRDLRARAAAGASFVEIIETVRAHWQADHYSRTLLFPLSFAFGFDIRSIQQLGACAIFADGRVSVDEAEQLIRALLKARAHPVD